MSIDSILSFINSAMLSSNPLARVRVTDNPLLCAVLHTRWALRTDSLVSFSATQVQTLRNSMKAHIHADAHKNKRVS